MAKKMKRKHWQLTAKVLVITCAVLAYGFIIHKLVSFEHWHTLISSFKTSQQTLPTLLLLLLLWLINLACETKKWQALMQPFTAIRFKKAWQQIMAGTTTAVGSPARIAEMGGRMALLPKQQHMNAAIMTTVGGIIQNLIIFAGGLLTLLISPQLSDQIELPFRIIELAIALMVVVVVVILVFKLLFPKYFKFYVRSFQKMNRGTLTKSFTWTTLRYLTYISQLYAWCSLWGLNANLLEFIPAASIYFFLITIIPSHILVDMGIRGSVALAIFSLLFSKTPLILAAAFCLWCSNVIIPTIIGSYILVRQKLIKQYVIQKET